MKTCKLFLISLLAISVLSACSKDDDDCDNLSTNIVGTWQFEFDGSQVEFKSDGTLEDPNETLLSADFGAGALTEKTYTVEGNTLNVRVTESGGSQFAATTFDVTESSCNEIELSFIGLKFTMQRQ